MAYELKLLTGNANRPLAEEIAQYLHVPMADAEVTRFSDGEVFVHAMVPPARVLIIGATHIGQILAQLVKIAGYEVVVIDPRTAFAAEARFPGAALASTLPARRLNGKDWSQTSPGPVRVARNRPSPPNRAFLMPPTSWMS